MQKIDVPKHRLPWTDWNIDSKCGILDAIGSVFEFRRRRSTVNLYTSEPDFGTASSSEAQGDVELARTALRYQLLNSRRQEHPLRRNVPALSVLHRCEVVVELNFEWPGLGWRVISEEDSKDFRKVSQQLSSFGLSDGRYAVDFGSTSNHAFDIFTYFGR
jgi:hypothetical protein